MKISDIILAEKSGLSWGKWGSEKPKKADFPMSCRKGGAFPLTRKWRWTTAKFSVASDKFIVMVAYHIDVPEFQTVLAEQLGRDTRTLARFEFHANHPVAGWHLHACCGDVSNITAGVTKPVGQKRIPQVHNHHRQAEYCLGQESMSDTLAIKVASIRFGLRYQEDIFGHPMQ